jgi:hypothetical protein
MADMMIPFIMLLIITIALILERKYQEEKIVEIYEKKFKLWKQHTPNKIEKKSKELIGLIFLENDKITIEVFDLKILDKIKQKISNNQITYKLK